MLSFEKIRKAALCMDEDKKKKKKNSACSRDRVLRGTSRESHLSFLFTFFIFWGGVDSYDCFFEVREFSDDD